MTDPNDMEDHQADAGKLQSMKAETHTCANCKYSYKANVQKVYVWRCKIITAMFQTEKRAEEANKCVAWEKK